MEGYVGCMEQLEVVRRGLAGRSSYLSSIKTRWIAIELNIIIIP